jgi:GTPase SAR1 family protein
MLKIMEVYKTITEELKRSNDDLQLLFPELRTLPHASETAFSDWERICHTVRKQMAEETVRIAVVGAIKSGKSTLVNALLGGDYLKRGAGVITSIVTRIRSGSHLKATLNFKSWEEINQEIEQALLFFPYLKRSNENRGFEIRQKEERAALKKALQTLGSEHLVTNETRTTQSVILFSYIDGYDRVSGLISSNKTLVEYEDNDFEKHREFVGNESLAVFLKDLWLEIRSDRFESHVEIADCQGSDSPNPLHIAMIQDYLTKTHLIVYVVSSRTGLRQADIKFLSMIKKMGILENTLFVINCDFGEHESLDNLKDLITKAQKDISLIKLNPEIFTFSALYTLFSSKGILLAAKDRSKLAQWRKDKLLTSFSKDENSRFEQSLMDYIQRGKYRLLIQNHAERLWIAASGTLHWIQVHQDLLTKNASEVAGIIDTIRKHQTRVEQIKSIIKTTLDGALAKLKQELKTEIDRFFYTRSTSIVGRLNIFIRDYRVDYTRYESVISSSGFSGTMYQIFMDFKQALDHFIAESINPEVIRFIRTAETQIQSHLETISSPFEAMVKDALLEYYRSMVSVGLSSPDQNQAKWQKTDIQWVKEVSGIKIPQADISMRYSARIKTDAVMHFGIFSIAEWIARVFKKELRRSQDKEFRALEKGVFRMKHETEKSIGLHFMDYRENIKFQYLFKLAEYTSTHVYEALVNRFQDYASNLTLLGEQVVLEKTDRIHALEKIRISKEKAEEIIRNLTRIRRMIETVNSAEEGGNEE